MRPMEMVRFGRGIRALRLRRGWRQIDLAAAAGVSQSIVSRIERGLGGRLTIETLARVAQALGSRVDLRLNWQGEGLDRLLDQDHARLVELVTRLSRRRLGCPHRGDLLDSRRAWIRRRARLARGLADAPGHRGQVSRAGRSGDVGHTGSKGPARRRDRGDSWLAPEDDREPARHPGIADIPQACRRPRGDVPCGAARPARAGPPLPRGSRRRAAPRAHLSDR